MDVRLSPEQQALRDSAARVVHDLGPRTVASLDDAERAAKLDAAVAAAGWRDLRSDHDGQPFASGVEVAIVAEELGRGLADTSFLGATLAAELRRLAGAPPAGGTETVLLTADLAAVAAAVDDDAPDRWLAVDAAGASAALLLVPADGGSSVAGIELAGPEVTVDLTRPCSAPRSGAAITPIEGQDATVTAEGLQRLVALGLAATSADLVGTMQGAVDRATAYATERRQYGRPVGSFQAVQHLLADALVATEGSRSVARHAAWAVDALAPRDALIAAATAKAYAARAARQVCETAIQVHGGIGNTWDCLAHVQLRRVLLSSDLFGGVDANLSRVLDDRLGTT